MFRKSDSGEIFFFGRETNSKENVNIFEKFHEC